MFKSLFFHSKWNAVIFILLTKRFLYSLKLHIQNIRTKFKCDTAVDNNITFYKLLSQLKMENKERPKLEMKRNYENDLLFYLCFKCDLRVHQLKTTRKILFELFSSVKHSNCSFHHLSCSLYLTV